MLVKFPVRCNGTNLQESSRNSEVIHAGNIWGRSYRASHYDRITGLYYPAESLKTRLCLRGRDMLYERCIDHHIPYRQTGKLVVARAEQRSYIENLYKKSLSIGWPPRSMSSSSDMVALPTSLLSGEEARVLEPELSTDIVAALWSPMTGIVDSHALMESLEKDIIDSDGGELVYSTRVVRIDPFQRTNKPLNAPSIDAAMDGWVVQTVTGNAEDGDSVLARTLINTSGLSSTLILNSILPEEKRIPSYYARGSYASYNGPGISRVSHLIYPCPETRGNTHAFHSLGTHLTLDLQGKVRFGPDIEWISPPTDDDDTHADFWENHLVPDETRMRDIHQAVTSYLPQVTSEGLRPDYTGVRPKLVPPHAGFQDFVFRSDFSTQVAGKERWAGAMISCLGIESPGLTSSLAIAEYVVEDLLAGNEQAKIV
jgi:2-hydroxyglutarate dehydrogenase